MVASFALVGCKKKNKTTTNNKPTQRRNANSKPAPARTADAGVVGKEVTYKAGDTTLKGYLAYDKTKKGKRPGVLVVHEWWGHNDYARRRARMLAKLGYVAFALDMYGEGKNTGHPKNAQKFMMSVMKNMKQGVERFKAAKAVLEKHDMTDKDKLAAIGYCFGGAIVLHMARIGMDLDGVASFHGNLKSMHKPKKGEIKAEVLVMNGAADPFVPAKSIEAFKAEMKKAGATFKFVNYKGAKHAFTNPGATEKGKKFKLPLAYDKEADEKSWAEMKAFFARIFKS
ncbi:MAG: dienelactone hydrolase family protein [Deltaproteobacteria bacterium]|nr:MAG: dienelactone hydrolase family protein [Deltaproteobacteria bacterium]